MFKLEHGELDVAKSKAMAPELERLEFFQDRMRDDFARNQELRKIFRVQFKLLDVAEKFLKAFLFQTKKKEIKKQIEADQHLLQKSSLSIDLVPENDDDVHLASLLTQYKTVTSEAVFDL